VAAAAQRQASDRRNVSDTSTRLNEPG